MAAGKDWLALGGLFSNLAWRLALERPTAN